MNLAQKQGSEGDWKLYTGVFLGTALAVNPSVEELGKLKGYTPKDDAKEWKTEGADDKGNEYVEVAFHLQATEHPDKPWFVNKIRLTDKDVVSEKSGSIQYVNATGGSSYVTDEKNLLEWFKNFQDKDKKNIADMTYRQAIEGEASLYGFLRAWMGSRGKNYVDFYDPQTNILIDKKKAFRNINKFVAEEYGSLIKLTPDETLVRPVVCLATVRTSEKDGKQYQGVYREFLPGYLMSAVSLAATTGNWIRPNLKKEDKRTPVEKWYEQIVDVEHGIKKDAFSLGLLKEFKADEHIQTQAATFVGPEDNSKAPTNTSY